MEMIVKRRSFLGLLAAAPLAMAPARPATAAASPPVCVFSKHLQFLDYPALAKTCREIGLDGVDLTVRRGGHVLPERVAEDLPRAAEAIRAEGLDIPMITTRFQSGTDDDLEAVLRTASELGIKYFRIGGHRYDTNGDPLAQLKQVEADLRSLSALAEHYDMTAGYHNHSGSNYVGAPLWDLLRVYESVGSAHLGSNLDLGHATVEGAYGDWQITTRALAAHTRMVAVKDFVFDDRKPRWVPLGKGVVETTEMLRILRKAGFAGPISLHCEYRVASDAVMIEQLRRGVVTLREAMSRAGF